MRPWPRNLITDVQGLSVGNADDATIWTGVTVLLTDSPAIAAVDISGGAPATRGSAALGQSRIVERVDAVVLSGGSEYGLDAPGAVLTELADQGRGFFFGGKHVPIVSGAALFDLHNGGDKDWGKTPPYPALARAALADAGPVFNLGNAGAGYGALAGPLKGGLGSASVVDPQSGHTVGALVAVNPRGSTVVPGMDCFWAAPYAKGDELGDQPVMGGTINFSADLGEDAGAPKNTVLAIVACDATLTTNQAERMAIMAQDGIGRAIRPAHTPFDGDVVFGLSTERRPLDGDLEGIDPNAMLLRLGALAADALARAIARGVYEASDLGESKSYRTWRAR